VLYRLHANVVYILQVPLVIWLTLIGELVLLQRTEKYVKFMAQTAASNFRAEPHKS